MLNRIFPKQFDNNYRGHWLALVILAVILVLRSLMGFNGIFDTLQIATSADGIPVPHFAPDAAQVVLALFALLAASNLMPVLLGLLALLRYRTLVPLIYLLSLSQSLFSRSVGLLHPMATDQSSSSVIGSGVILALFALAVLGFVLSLLDKSGSRESPAAT